MEAEAACGILQIILFDLILSGDNAVVIGVIAGRLRGRQRRIAIVVGAGGAVVLRIAFASVATLLLNAPVVAAVGGVLLFWIGARLLVPEGRESAAHREAGSLRKAIQLIILADVVMSLDNVLTVAGAAQGNIWLLVFGLALSIPLLFVGAQVIALTSARLPVIVYLGSALIFRVAVVLIIDDSAIHSYWHPNLVIEHVLPWVAAIAGPGGYVLQARLRGRPTVPILVNPFRPEPDSEPSAAPQTSGADGSGPAD